MSGAPMRQQPPTYVAPAATHATASAGSNAPGPTQPVAPPCQASPRFGYATAGLPVTEWAVATALATSAGAQQLTPTATTAS